jgi:hypothetical protein
MYRFYGDPLQSIRSKQTNRVLFVFDTKGEFITDDENIIRRCLGFFDNMKLESKDISLKERKTYNIPPMTITHKGDKKVEPIIEPKEDLPILKHCKKCDFVCENQGDLLTHYRQNHSKKEGK